MSVRSRRLLQHMPVQKQDRAQPLILSALGQRPSDRQMGEKHLDLFLSHLSGMSQLARASMVKPQKLLDPAAVCLDGSRGQSADLAGRRVLLEEYHLPSLPRKNCSVNSRSRFDASLSSP